MDGSRRSAHGNAYFTGFGAAKRIVFFDTLLARLSGSEIEAVLAHELGHFKRRHVLKLMIVMFGISLAMLALLGWLIQTTWFYEGLGVRPSLVGSNNGLALVLFMLVLPVFMFFITPLGSLTSRKNEFEADAFAASQTDPKDLVNALVKLYEDNASTLTPDPHLHRVLLLASARFAAHRPPDATRRMTRGSRRPSVGARLEGTVIAAHGRHYLVDAGRRRRDASVLPARQEKRSGRRRSRDLRAVVGGSGRDRRDRRAAQSALPLGSVQVEALRRESRSTADRARHGTAFQRRPARTRVDRGGGAWAGVAHRAQQDRRRSCGCRSRANGSRRIANSATR